MIEKVNPGHPDKIADRIAGALVDIAYRKSDDPKIAVELTIGHGVCHIFMETDQFLKEDEICNAVYRITGITDPDDMAIMLTEAPQDINLARNQKEGIRCGDCGIFRSAPLTQEQIMLSDIAQRIYAEHPTDGKYVLDGKKLIICQSNTTKEELAEKILEDAFNIPGYPNDIRINPIGEWKGGTNVDTGSVNRKLASDMPVSSGGGIHGKDLSKPDVSVNIYAYIKAQETGRPVELSCAIGDETVDGRPYEEIVRIAREYIDHIGGFEKLAEWGLF